MPIIKVRTDGFYFYVDDENYVDDPENALISLVAFYGGEVFNSVCTVPLTRKDIDDFRSFASYGVIKGIPYKIHDGKLYYEEEGGLKSQRTLSKREIEIQPDGLQETYRVYFLKEGRFVYSHENIYKYRFMTFEEGLSIS